MEACIWILGLLNVIQLIFWAMYTHKLIDKLMSKNHAEYVQTQVIKKSMKSPEFVKTESDSINEDDVLNQLNGMLG